MLEHIETVILDNKFIDVSTPDGYHYEYKSDKVDGYSRSWKLVRNNALDCSNIELKYILKYEKYIHNIHIDGLTYIWSSINKFVQVYSSVFNISPSLMILQTIAELEVLRLKVRKELEEWLK